MDLSFLTTICCNKTRQNFGICPCDNVGLLNDCENDKTLIVNVDSLVIIYNDWIWIIVGTLNIAAHTSPAIHYV